MSRVGDVEQTPQIIDHEQQPKKNNILHRTISTTSKSIGNNLTQLEKFKNIIKPYLSTAVVITLLILYHGFLLAAAIHNFYKASTLIYITIFAWICFLISALTSTDMFQNFYDDAVQSAEAILRKSEYISIGGYAACIVAILSFVVFDARSDWDRLRGFCGYAFFIIIMVIFSNNRKRINWRIVLSALIMHFVFALLILRWSEGQNFFQKVSNVIVGFLDYTQVGTKFVFGFIANPPNICDLAPVFIFTSLQTLIYFGAIAAILFYYGIIQIVLTKLSWFTRVLIGTTAVESVNAWGCTFLGMTESPLMFAQYLDKLTDSEMHTVLSSGFACVAGTVFAAYVALGACPQYLVTASLMSAPGSIACSKILFPETEEPRLKTEEIQITDKTHSGVMDTLSSGASSLVPVVFSIGANILVMLALLQLFDDVIEYCGDLIGYPGWSFQLIIGYLFFPVAYLMGVTDPAQTLQVAQLMATKTAANEFVAYKHLGELQKDDLLTKKSAMIATYALCGFSNFGSTGMQIEVIGSLAPSKKPAIAKMIMRALCAGAITCFMNATVAGILIKEPTICASIHNSTCVNINQLQNVTLLQN